MKSNIYNNQYLQLYDNYITLFTNNIIIHY